jgi:hypothetical protein
MRSDAVCSDSFDWLFFSASHVGTGTGQWQPGAERGLHLYIAHRMCTYCRHISLHRWRVAHPFFLLSLPVPKLWVPLDKSEGGVKDKNILSVFSAPLFCQRGLRTKTLEISR